MKTSARPAPETRTRTRSASSAPVHEHPVPWHEMAGLAVIGLAFYLAWCYLYPFESGAWGQSVGLGLWQSAGEGGLVLCALLALWGVRLGFPQVVSRRILEGTLVALIEVLVLDVLCWLLADAGGTVGRSLGLASVEVVGRVGTWLAVVLAGLFPLLVWRRLAPSRVAGVVAGHLSGVGEAVTSLKQRLSRPAMPADLVLRAEASVSEAPTLAQEVPSGDVQVDPQAEPEDDEDSPPWDEPAAPETPPGNGPLPDSRAAPAPPRPTPVEPTRVTPGAPAGLFIGTVLPPRPVVGGGEPGWDLRLQLQTEYRIPPVELLARTEPADKQP